MASASPTGKLTEPSFSLRWRRNFRKVQMIAYRYLSAAHAIQAMSGKFLLRRLSYYRSEECPPDRRDEMENQTKGVLNVVSKGNEIPAEHYAAMRRVGIHIAPGAVRNLIVSDDQHFFIGPDFFVLCLSSTKTDRLATEGRDSIVKVSDVEGVGRLIASTHSDVLRFTTAGAVSYESRNFDPLTALKSPDPLKKETRFQQESEIRIVWEALDQRTTLLTHCPDIAPYISM